MTVADRRTIDSERLEHEPYGGCTLRVRQARRRRLNTKPSVCLERAKIMTEVFIKTEGEPLVIRKAKAFRELCERGTIFIQNHDLIIGNVGSRIFAGILSPDTNYSQLSGELNTIATRSQDPFLITEDQQRLFKEFIEPYWKGKSYVDICDARIPEDVRQLNSLCLINCSGRMKAGPSVIVADYERVITLGIRGIRKTIEDRRSSLDASLPGEYEKKVYLDALLIICDGMEARSARYARLAHEKASQEPDPQRRAELARIAEICIQVPMNPARNFWEALQSLWFYQVFLWMEHDSTTYNPGRIDQYLYPYLRRDLDEGRITKEQALELVECLWVKFAENCYLEDATYAKQVPGYLADQNVCCGGLDRKGQNAVNDLSYIMLQAMNDVRLTQPALAVKYNRRKNPDSFLRKAAELTGLGTGWPTWFNDEVGIRHCLDTGIPMEDAVNWNPRGCMAVGMVRWYDNCAASHVNVAAALELALLNGRHGLTGAALPVPQTGDPRSFSSYDEFKEAVKTQLACLTKKAAKAALVLETIGAEIRPVLVTSLSYPECVDKARDAASGGAKYALGGSLLIAGTADLVDSLVCIKKLVYEERRLSWDQLLRALTDNFEGHEAIRQMCLEAPKYGNDIPEVDAIATEMTGFVAEEIRKFHSLSGARMSASSLAAAGHLSAGAYLGALPSGRKARLPVADGMSPMQGTDRNGPTAVLKSLSRCRVDLLTAGCLLNMKLDPAIFKNERGVQDFMAMMKSWADLGLYHLQFNVVSADTLLDAQKHPEKYRDLLVRVSGYSAYFVDLNKDIQDDIISRTTVGKVS